MSATTPLKKLYIKTYGCQMNVYDSERMEEMLAPLGYAATDTPDDADMVVLNTCHIREKAAEKVYSELGRIRPLKDKKAAEGSRMVLAVAGCVAQAEGEEMKKRAPYVDIIVGPQTYQQLPDLVAKVRREEEGEALALEFEVEEKFDRLPEERMVRGTQAFLTIQEGCDKFCTYCVVPYTRGAEYSRPVAEVMKEARQLVARGAREITLLGQNVNDYHGKVAVEDAQRQIEGAQINNEWGLGRLIRHLTAELPELRRIRYTTSHPGDVDEELIAAHRDVAILMPFLHLPVQSGSNRILKAMNRKHTAKKYLSVIEKLRAARPDIAFSSDFIVGFPGETEEDFEETMALVREVGFAQAFSFKYSPRPGTPAAAREDTVPEEVKTERLMRLQALLSEQQMTFNRSVVGQEHEIIIEREGRLPGQKVGRNAWMQLVHVDACGVPVGGFATARITRAIPQGVMGELVVQEVAKAA